MRFLRILVRSVVTLLALLIIAILTRRYWVPERYAVNVPMRALTGAGAASDSAVSSLRAPPGFTLTRFATGLGNARFMRVTEAGDVLVSQPREGRVTLLQTDSNHDGVSDGATPLVSGLDRPHGLALRDGYLYVAEMTAVGRIAFDDSKRITTGSFERVITGLPGGGNHWTRTIGFGPDGFLYVSIGSSCNVCIESDPRRAAISRYDPLTWRGSVFASGLRNAVGFAWRRTGDAATAATELIATDNGRDLLGNDFPPCELNRVVEGGFYGWPFANVDRVKDPDFGSGHESDIGRSLPPIHHFAAHNAPLGITFLAAPATPDDYRGAALVALHGSWNRTTKDGYKVVSLHWDSSGRITERDFLTGFLKDDAVIGRPVDVAQGQDGSIYVSDDFGGSVFRLASGGPALVETRSPLAAGSPLLTTPAPVATVGDDATIARGFVVWTENRCAQCHDPAVIGKNPVKTAKVLEHLSSRYDISKMVTYLKAPQPPMPLFELSDKERGDLAAYVLNRFR